MSVSVQYSEDWGHAWTRIRLTRIDESPVIIEWLCGYCGAHRSRAPTHCGFNPPRKHTVDDGMVRVR